jgi:hypothetical protein
MEKGRFCSGGDAPSPFSNPVKNDAPTSAKASPALFCGGDVAAAAGQNFNQMSLFSLTAF